MTSEEEQLLKTIVEKGVHICYWSPGDIPAKKVLSVAERKDEPGLVAYLEGHPGGRYVALYNAPLSDFVQHHPINKVQERMSNPELDFNLDCMDPTELVEFFNAHSGPGLLSKAEKLFPSQPYGFLMATLDLAVYARHKAHAMEARLAGEIVKAGKLESICNQIYARLPRFARW